MIRSLVLAIAIALGLITPPAIPQMHGVIESDVTEWNLYWREAEQEYADEFTALFDSYEYKLSKNGRSMIKRPGESFKFVAKAKKA